ncbi:hypothetical protein HYX03_02240 [Candidatus Woesearchaeota archaeon]|nr:hypothetical protein [Candidatus Woesearchaeota archaeon]
MKHLTLDGILKNTESDGILREKDEDSPTLRRYKFLLDESVAEVILENLEHEIPKSRNYKIRQKLNNSGDIDRGIEFNYRRLFFGDYHYFASVYILDESFPRAIKTDHKGKRTLMIEGVYTTNRNDPFLKLMRVFYSAYQNSKTPSKT